MDLEKIATSALVSSISQTDILSGFINNGDKEPCWDGNIYIYENSSHSKKNIKRIPTQVKGKGVKGKVAKNTIKYRVTYDDLQAYMMDGGTLFFVVYIDKKTGEPLQIYYADLLPVRIMEIIKQKQDSYSISFAKFSSDNKKKIEIVLDAYDNAQKQKSYAGQKLPTIDELSKEGILESISFNITHTGANISPSTIPQIMEGKSITLYANIKGNPIGIPVEHHKNITHVMSYQYIDEKIYVNDIEYYDHYKIVHSASTAKTIIGNCLTITAPIFDENINEKLVPVTININVKGTLKEQIKGFEFVKAVFDNNGFEISNNHIPIKLKENKFEEKIQEFSYKLDGLNYIRNLLETMHIKKDLELDDFSKEDEENLNFLIAAIGERKPVRKVCEGSYSIQLLKISNIALGVVYIKHTDGNYYMYDYFGNHFEAYWKNDDKEMRISQFSIMNVDDFLKYDNMFLPIIIEDFKSIPPSDEIINNANLLMLDMIKAYDQFNNEELLDAAEQINDWLKEYSQFIDSDICIINGCQIAIRKRKLEYGETSKLIYIAEKSDNINYRAAAFILLGYTDEVNKIFSLFDTEQMEEFSNFPIYFLYKLSQKLNIE